MATATPSIGTFIVAAIKDASMADLKIILPIINTEVQALIANPANIIAIKAVLMAQLVAAFPQMASTTLQSLAADIKADLALIGSPLATALGGTPTAS